jgi:hypothetical protein
MISIPRQKNEKSNVGGRVILHSSNVVNQISRWATVSKRSDKQAKRQTQNENKAAGEQSQQINRKSDLVGVGAVGQ